MPYRTSREGEWGLVTAWRWFINMMALDMPGLFGCRAKVLPQVKSQRQIDNIGDLIRKLGGVQVAENQNLAKERVDFFYRLEGKPVVVVVQKDKPVKLIGPAALAEHVTDKLKEFLG